MFNSKKKKSILVTGGAGFIGSGITSALVKAGHDVTVFDNFTRGSKNRIRKIKDKIKIISGDIRDVAQLSNAVGDNEVIIHLAYINGTRYFYEQPELVLDVGLRGMLNIVDAIKESKVKEFYLASSSEVYQKASVIPTDENVQLSIPDPRNPRYSYGGGKIACELITLHWIRQLVEKTVIFRPHNVYGANMGMEHVIPELTQRAIKLSSQLKEDELLKLPIKGDGSAQRAFIYIDDFISAFMKILEEGKDGDIYNIGTSEEVSIVQLANLIGDILGHRIEIIASDVPTGETDRRVPDISLIKTLGFQSKVSLSEGLSRVMQTSKDVNL